MTSVNITRRVNVEGKGPRFCKVIIGGGGKIKPDVVLVGGREYTCPETSLFYIDFLLNGKRTRRAAGSTATEAKLTAEKQEAALLKHRAAAKAGIALPEPEVTGNGRSLRNAVRAYLVDIQARKKPKTHSAYATALKYFLESCSKQTLEQITRADLLAYQIYLREKKQSDRSVSNKFENVCSFLKQQKIIVSGPNGLISKNDWPVYTEEEVDVYTDQELTKFFGACDETEKVWFKFFYITAMREQEVMYVSWSDIDFEQRSMTVRENKRFGFRPKAYKGRSIRISADLLNLLKTWKEKSDQTCGLVFSTAGCKPKFDFLDCCKAIAKRAGLNQSDFYLHKFRATRATRLLQGGLDVKTVQKILGHTDMESTMRYLGAQRDDVIQAQIEQIDSL